MRRSSEHFPLTSVPLLADQVGCLDRRIDSYVRLTTEPAFWQKHTAMLNAPD